MTEEAVVTRMRKQNQKQAVGMNLLKEKYQDLAKKNITSSIRRPGKRTGVEYHTWTDTSEDAQIMNSLVSYANLDGMEENQVCAYYCSLLTCIFPDLFSFCKIALNDAGADITMFRSPAEREIISFELVEEENDFSNNLVLFGQAVLILYKNISKNSYTNYMSSRVNALRAHAGVSVETKTDVAFSERAAEVIRRKLGTKRILKIGLLHTLLEVSKIPDVLGEVCAYLTFMLSWNAMGTLVIINDAFLATQSPILRDLSVQSEVHHLADAFETVNKYQYPQYFSIIGTPQETRCMERSKFPILFAVAQTLRKKQINSITNFETSAGISYTLVMRLVSIPPQVHQRSRSSGCYGRNHQLPPKSRVRRL